MPQLKYTIHRKSLSRNIIQSKNRNKTGRKPTKTLTLALFFICFVFPIFSRPLQLCLLYSFVLRICDVLCFPLHIPLWWQIGSGWIPASSWANWILSPGNLKSRSQFVCLPWIEGHVIFGLEFQASSPTCTKKTNFQKTKKKADRQRKRQEIVGS